MSNIVFRINILLAKSNVANTFDSDKFVWQCYLFVRGRYCKFTIKIYRCVGSEPAYLVDIDKIDNSGFIFREWVEYFKLYFKNIQEISSKISDISSSAISTKLSPNTMIYDLYMDSLVEISCFRSKDDTIGCIDFLLEILEFKQLHSYAFETGIHFKLCYLLTEIEFEEKEQYSTIDTILYMLFLLSQGPQGRIILSKCRSFVDFLNKKIHQDLEYYQLYTLELAQAILSNIVQTI